MGTKKVFTSATEDFIELSVFYNDNTCHLLINNVAEPLYSDSASIRIDAYDLDELIKELQKIRELMEET